MSNQGARIAHVAHVGKHAEDANRRPLKDGNPDEQNLVLEVRLAYRLKKLD
jgi:hypothetical protein